MGFMTDAIHQVLHRANGRFRPGADIRAARYLPLGYLPRGPRHDTLPILLAALVIDVSPGFLSNGQFCRRVEEMHLPRLNRKADVVTGVEPCLRVNSGHRAARLAGLSLDQDFRTELFDHLYPRVETHFRERATQDEMFWPNAKDHRLVAPGRK